MTDDQVEVIAQYFVSGEEGSGWYLFELEYQDEGWVAFFDHKPSQQEVSEVCPEFILSQ